MSNVAFAETDAPVVDRVAVRGTLTTVVGDASMGALVDAGAPEFD